MKVAVIAPKARGLGGIARHVSGLVKWLKRRGVDAELVTPRYIPVRMIANASGALYLTLWSLRERIHKYYDVLNAHHVFSAIGVYLAPQPLVLTLHGDFLSQEALLHPRLHRVARIVEEAAVKRASIVTAVSPVTARVYRERYGVETLLTPNAIDPSEAPRVERRVYDVALVARLDKEKGVDIFIEALRILQERGIRLTAVVAGDGPLRSMVEAAARDGLLKYLGSLPHREAWRVICKSRILVLPSRREGLPTVALEAMACKTPILASDIPELREALQDAVYLAKPEPQSLAEAIIELLSDEDLASRLAEAGYKLLIEKYTWEKVVNAYIRAYRLALDKAR